MTSDTSFGALIDDVAVVHEDERVIVVDKPAGLLSQPGKSVHDSLVVRVRAARPSAHGPMMMHRLDMDTSGLVILAKDPDAHRDLSGQFERREIAKTYRAVLEREPVGLGGRISLSLRLDPDDRPRQVVCDSSGRRSETVWRRLSGQSRTVILQPLTGRTHQLRVHAAHARGLNAAIVGDRLYGKAGERLLLHAERIAFRHPGSGERLQCVADLPADWPSVSGERR